MLSFKNSIVKTMCFGLMLCFFNLAKAQPKGVSPELIKEFSDYLGRHAMPVTTYLENSKDLSTYVKLLKRTKVYNTLKSEDDITIFVPVNEAFDQFPVEVMNELFQPENSHKLRDIITYHIMNGKLRASEIIRKIDKNNSKETRFTTISGLDIVAYYDESDLFIKDDNGYSIKIIQQDINLSNGIVYKIETVMLPQIDNHQKVGE